MTTLPITPDAIELRKTLPCGCSIHAGCQDVKQEGTTHFLARAQAMCLDRLSHRAQLHDCDATPPRTMAQWLELSRAIRDAEGTVIHMTEKQRKQLIAIVPAGTLRDLPVLPASEFFDGLAVVIKASPTP